MPATKELKEKIALSTPNPISLHADPLSDFARKERRHLLASSLLGFLVSQEGLVPAHPSIFGFEFSQPSPRAFEWIVVAIIVYFLIAFFIYGLSDFFGWMKRYQDYIEKVEVEGRNWTEEDQQAYDDLHADIPVRAWLYSGSKPVAVARVIFEFIIPILAGLVSLILLIMSATKA
jgi:hypothetical protein